ncbi:MAG: 23S rRNA pseudouridine(1911/1915/1917) synthase RluD [Pseudomonadota bacterium]
MNKKEKLATVIPEEYRGLRLDHALAKIYPEYSRARLQKWIKSGEIKIDGQVLRPKDRVHGGENIEVDVVFEDEVLLEPENIPLNILYQDDQIIIVNKPADFVVHPGAGNANGTMANALLHHFQELRVVPRVGIVHRLDKDTTGLLVVARENKAHTNLVEQLQQRTVSRKYIALVHGEFISGGTYDDPIGRHSVDRKKMAVKPSIGREAITYYRIRNKFNGFTLLDVNLETGRTHQIRVHMAHHQHPIVGDRIYGRKINASKKKILSLLAAFPRQALHAEQLSFKHPATNKEVSFHAPIPSDFQELIDALTTNHVA